MSKRYIIVAGTEGAYKGVAYPTETDAIVEAWFALKNRDIEEDLDFVNIQEIEVPNAE